MKVRLTAEGRKVGAERLCKALGCTPAQVFDPVFFSYFGEFRLYPANLEKFLSSRGTHPIGGESIRDCVARVYGAETAALADALL